MGGRNKIHASEQIGRLGIGFVSVYQITDTPIVRSSGTELTLNSYSGKVAINSPVETDGTEFELAWASLPSDIREALNASPTPDGVSSKLVTDPHLRPLWSAIARMIDVSRKRLGFDKILEKLKGITFLLDMNAKPVTPTDVWRLLGACVF